MTTFEDTFEAEIEPEPDTDMADEPDVDPFTLERHPVSAAFEALDADEFYALEQSVRLHGVVGCRVIVGYVTGSPEHSGKVIDGWHTLCAWKECCRHDDRFAQRHPIATKRMWFPTEQALREFALSLQLGRRNMEKGKQALLAVRLLNGSATVAAGAPDGGATVARPLKNIMNFFRPGSRLMKMVERIARREPEIGDAYLAGEIGLREAEAAASLPAGEQREAVAGGTDGLKDKALEVRDRRDARREAAGDRDHEAEWRRERERPLPEPPPIQPRAAPRAPEARREPAAEDWVSEVGGLEDPWAGLSEPDRANFLRSKVASFERALTPEQWDDIIARHGGGRANGSDQAASELLRLGDALMRAMPHNSMVNEFCSKVANKVTSKGVAQRRV